MTVEIADFAERVAPDVEGCSSPVIKDKVISTLIDFCVRGRVWHYNHRDIILVPGHAEYEFDMPPGTRATEVLTMVNVDGEPIVEKSAAWLDEHVPNWRTEEDDPVKYYQTNLLTAINVIPVPEDPDGPGLLGVRLLLVPERSITAIDDIFYNDWLEAIEYGTKARLLREPNKPWTDMKTAKEYQSLYEFELAKANSQINRGETGKTTSHGLKRGMYG